MDARSCSDEAPCALHRAGPVRDAYLKMLKETSLADLTRVPLVPPAGAGHLDQRGAKPCCTHGAISRNIRLNNINACYYGRVCAHPPFTSPLSPVLKTHFIQPMEVST